jgi:flagellar hook-associated protein 3 FlgL
MRVNPFYISNLAASLNQTQATEQQLTAQLSSGVRVNALSDDPLAAGENVELLNQIQRDDSFTQTSSLVQGQLQVSDSALGSVVSQLTQAISLATSANNGTLNATDLKSISNQIAGIRDEVVSLANTSYQGQYIFGGSQTGTSPFTISNSSGTTPAAATYNGDGVANYIVTANGQRIQLNVPGDQIFMGAGTNNVLNTLNKLVADFASGQAGAGAVADTTALNTALNFVSQQRVVLDNSLTRLTAATDAANSEQTQLTAAQTNLMQADVAKIATQLSLSETQQTALENVIAQLGAGSLFDKLPG